MEVRLHPNQAGYIITFPNGLEYAIQEGDKYYEQADYIFNNPVEYIEAPVEVPVEEFTPDV